jgi:hypothetical protein
MTTFSLVRGRAMRATRLDVCGNPVLGPDSVVVTEGFVSAGLTPNVETGEAITVTNANGVQCVNDTPDASFVNYGVAITFCGVNVELLSMLTGSEVVLGGDGTPKGFRQNSRRKVNASFALEVWTGVAGRACGDTGAETFGYALIPFIKGGVLGDFTFENGAVTFSLTNATTRDGTGWGVGPYDVVADESGVESPLADVLDPYDHLHLELTTVPPPSTDDDSATELGVEATGATAGSPGEFTPANSYGPLDLAELQASAITADPNTAWSVGQYVTLRDGTKAHWTGSAWAAGAA